MDVIEGVHCFHLAHYSKWSSVSSLYEQGTKFWDFIRAGNLMTRSVTYISSFSELTVL